MVVLSFFLYTLYNKDHEISEVFYDEVKLFCTRKLTKSLLSKQFDFSKWLNSECTNLQ